MRAFGPELNALVFSSFLDCVDKVVDTFAQVLQAFGFGKQGALYIVKAGDEFARRYWSKADFGCPPVSYVPGWLCINATDATAD